MNEYWLEYRLHGGEWQLFNVGPKSVDYMRGFIGYFRQFGVADWRICRRTSVNTFEVVHLSLSATSEPDDGTELPQEGN